MQNCSDDRKQEVESLSENNLFLLHALFTGMFITYVYDGCIIVRKVIPHKKFVESLEDLAFWIFCAGYVFLWLYRESNGTLRWFAVAGALAGMILYKKTVSRLWIKSAVWFLEHVLRIGKKLLALLVKPVRFMAGKVAAQHRKASLQRRKILGNLKIRLKSYGKALKIKLSKR